MQQPVTRYLEATGNAAAVNTVDLVARVQGFRAGDQLQGRRRRQEGRALFMIEPEPYKLKLEQAQAREAGAQADADAGARPSSSAKPTLLGRAGRARRRRSIRRWRNARLGAADAASRRRPSTQSAQHQLGYTHVTAPFDGIVTAHLVSVGELVGGAATPTSSPPSCSSIRST